MTEFDKDKAGFLKNKDGSFSDKYFLILIISLLLLLPSAVIIIYWSFKDMPLPQMALELLKVLIENFKYVLIALITCQSADNISFFKDLKNDKEKND